MLVHISMNAAAGRPKQARSDFYASTLAPVRHARQSRFSTLDIVLLAVLFLEITAVMRLFLAN